MFNPFVNRSIEQIRDETAFLSVVTPDPLEYLLRDKAEDGRLYTRLVQIFGPPGTGKTTLGRLFEFHVIAALLRHPDIAGAKETLKVMIACQAIDDQERPRILGFRLGLEGQYRQIWELPYREELKTRLLNSLIQARTIQGWLHALEIAGVGVEQTRIVARKDSETILSTIGGNRPKAILARANQVEQSIYALVAALDPPSEAEVDLTAIGAYHPFDIIEKLEIRWRDETLALTPLLILDDTTKLHREQYAAVERWLDRREMRIGRWMLGWQDLLPLEVLISGHAQPAVEHPGLTAERNRVIIQLHETGTSEKRTGARRRFGRIAPSIAGRYLRRMTTFAQRGFQELGQFISEERPDAPRPVIEALEKRIKSESRTAGLGSTTIASLRQQVDAYSSGAETKPKDDERLEMTRILMHRFSRRNPQTSLFALSDDDADDADGGESAMRVNANLAEGARVHLMHEHKRPLYYGIETLCDAASMNVEQFLFLCAPIVEDAETRLIRGRNYNVEAARQHELLRQRATRAVERDWRFPHANEVLRLGKGIAERCLKRSMERNAPLGPGANALGVLQADFDRLITSNRDFADVLRAALAHNALSLVRDQSCKRKIWTLLQLNGMLILHHGLSLRWGGFVEARAQDLVDLAFESES